MMDNKRRIRYKQGWIAQKALRTSVVKGETEIRSGPFIFMMGVPLNRNHSLLTLDLVFI